MHAEPEGWRGEADTSSRNYLVLIGEADLLGHLYGRVAAQVLSTSPGMMIYLTY